MQTLPTRTSNVVMMVDTSDMHLLCGADELLAKRRVLTGGDDNTVVVGGEPILWPDQQKFNGQSLSQNPEPYPVKNCVFLRTSQRTPKGHAKKLQDSLFFFKPVKTRRTSLNNLFSS